MSDIDLINIAASCQTYKEFANLANKKVYQMARQRNMISFLKISDMYGTQTEKQLTKSQKRYLKTDSRPEHLKNPAVTKEVKEPKLFMAMSKKEIKSEYKNRKQKCKNFVIERKRDKLALSHLASHFGEVYVTKKYNGQLATNQHQPGWDVMNKTGNRISVKTMLTPSAPSTNYKFNASTVEDSDITILMAYDIDSKKLHEVYNGPTADLIPHMKNDGKDGKKLYITPKKVRTLTYQNPIEDITEAW